MALPMSPANRWIRELDSPFRLMEQAFDTWDDYELYEEDNEFVLAINLPGFDPDDITVSWNDGVLNVAGDHTDSDRGHEKTYHRRFRFPKDIEEDDIAASYNNGVLEVTLPLAEGATVHGREIPISA